MTDDHLRLELKLNETNSEHCIIDIKYSRGLKSRLHSYLNVQKSTVFPIFNICIG